MSEPRLSNAARFIEAYNRVDRQLEEKQSDTDYVSFSKRVRESKLLVALTREALLEYAQLRNLILHT